ncbi:RsmB/NOP family class I SAM-dependent RNA methyltransferase [Synechococcales cyanobacterium C]|uniref:RsmB/NOP family class I SAM-dependent RNA methyltransferase n=1 Tax=Petrachloros mirabilis ULC683 TaxID=2781853 RepID=A0A8K2A8Q7_9CYAN|nr:RsmB/NOP family class I SAM-dependent RNA methyltransferase [Petrachloros mirabilis]NCJ07330.1 RsmB/NOP family class I SAM-dependent RNA methyltransferase [Petrachloros mirabilis ULC683]
MKSPSNLLRKLSRKLFADVDTQASFIEALVQPRPLHPCILWMRSPPQASTFGVQPPLDWQPDFVERLDLEAEPGRHPWHDQGFFYCLDFSSVFAASVVLGVREKPALVLDVCAAPGGKSLFVWRALAPRLLLCNETIGKRVGMLVGNLKRCSVQPVGVLNLDPEAVAQVASQVADLVIVDAPCTGQSLLAKGKAVPGCFHPVTINQNANRQKRILANAAAVVAPGGFLAYMTCAFSPQENEQVLGWFLRQFPQFQAQPVPHLQAYQSHLSDLPCYRMWPQLGLGAGAFTALLKNTTLGDALTWHQETLLQLCRWQSENGEM